MAPTPDDPRLFAAQCLGLQPVALRHQNPWFGVYDRGGYFTVEYNQPQVIVLAVVDREWVVMVRVKRPVICDTPLELPAGAMEVGESALAGAQRELGEETGIRLTDVTRFCPLPPMCISPTRFPMLLNVVRVDLSREEFDGRAAHDSEISSVVLLGREEVRGGLRTGEIYISVPAAILACHFLAP